MVTKIEPEILLAGSNTIDIENGSTSPIIGDGSDIEAKPNSRWDDYWY